VVNNIQAVSDPSNEAVQRVRRRYGKAFITIMGVVGGAFLLARLADHYDLITSQQPIALLDMLSNVCWGVAVLGFVDEPTTWGQSKVENINRRYAAWLAALAIGLTTFASALKAVC
jgi:uncharacterized membrane protein